MRKLGLGIVVLLIAAAIYYFTTGSAQITTEIKKQLNAQLTSIQEQGFSVQNREIKEKSEHFILSFDDPKKIAQFLSRQGVQANVNDAVILKGLKVGVDVTYLADTYSSVAFDIYPVTLPSLISASAINDTDKKALTQVEKMLEKKTFLMHIAINKIGSGFKGHMRDIDEVLHGEKDVKISMKKLTFSGDIKNNAIISVKQELKELIMNVTNEMQFKVTGIKSNYTITGETPYDYSTSHSIDKMHISVDSDFDFLSNNLHMHSVSIVKDGLASASISATVEKIQMTEDTKHYAFDTFILESSATGVDVTAFEKLQEIDVNNKEEVRKVLQQMLSKGIHLEVQKCSVENIVENSTKIGTFDIRAKVNLDKSFDINAIETNPMSLLSSVDANLKLTLSPKLFTILAQQPQAMMLAMLFQPKDVNGKKVYEIDLKKGKLLVNGMSIM